VSILDKLNKAQEKELTQIESIQKDILQTQAAVKKKLEKVTNFHQLLVKRVEHVLRIISTHQGGLTPAEKQFHKELKQKHQKIPLYQAKIKDVRTTSKL
jgi:hypothetical protein